MAKLVRKNLMVDADALRELARIRGLSESETVRQLVAFALAAEEVGDAIRELHELGGLPDVFSYFPDDSETETSGVSE